MSSSDLNPSPEEKLITETAAIDLTGSGHASLNSVKIRSSGNIYVAQSTWDEIFPNAEHKLLKDGVTNLGWTRPSGIQGEALPQIIKPGPDGKWRNLQAQAHHGSGKTGTYVLAMLSRLNLGLRKCQGLCLSPTREVAMMSTDTIRQLGHFMGDLKVRTAVPPADGERRKKAGVVTEQIVTGTARTVLNLFGQGRKRQLLDGKHIQVLVIDEADYMLQNPSMANDVKRIKQKLNPNVQVLLFSATFPRSGVPTIRAFLGESNQTIKILVEEKENHLVNVHHFYVDCSSNPGLKHTVLTDIYDVAENVGQSIIFIKTKAEGQALQKKLAEEGYQISFFSSKLSPEERDREMKRFQERETNVLLATDVLGRGVDVPAVTLVTNMELPYHHNNRELPNATTYVQRMGRAGRFGRKGVGVTLISSARELEDLGRICSQHDIELRALPHDNNAELERLIQSVLG
jgi:ATP-dependent RNA helicase DDX19/DBP5